MALYGNKPHSICSVREWLNRRNTGYLKRFTMMNDCEAKLEVDPDRDICVHIFFCTYSNMNAGGQDYAVMDLANGDLAILEKSEDGDGVCYYALKLSDEKEFLKAAQKHSAYAFELVRYYTKDRFPEFRKVSLYDPSEYSHYLEYDKGDTVQLGWLYKRPFDKAHGCWSEYSKEEFRQLCAKYPTAVARRDHLNTVSRRALRAGNIRSRSVQPKIFSFPRPSAVRDGSQILSMENFGSKLTHSVFCDPCWMESRIEYIRLLITEAQSRGSGLFG